MHITIATGSIWCYVYSTPTSVHTIHTFTPHPTYVDPFHQTLIGHLHQVLDSFVHLANKHSLIQVTMVTIMVYCHINCRMTHKQCSGTLQDGSGDCHFMFEQLTTEERFRVTTTVLSIDIGFWVSRWFLGYVLRSCFCFAEGGQLYLRYQGREERSDSNIKQRMIRWTVNEGFCQANGYPRVRPFFNAITVPISLQPLPSNVYTHQM